MDPSRCFGHRTNLLEHISDPHVVRVKKLGTLYFFGVVLVYDTARVERAPFHRARSASKKGCLAAPCPALASPSSTPVQYDILVTPWLSDSFGSFRDSVIGAIEGPDLYES